MLISGVAAVGKCTTKIEIPRKLLKHCCAYYISGNTNAEKRKTFN
jgi:hypothetical protein